MITIIIILIIFTFLIFLKYHNSEQFDSKMNEFLPVGYIRYGLRGDKLNTQPMPDCYYDKHMCYFNTSYF